jgi:low affinity Fe/Cu permease
VAFRRPISGALAAVGSVKGAKVSMKVDPPIATKTIVVTGPDRFGKFSARCARYLGSRWSFIAAIGVILVWASTGPIFHYSDTWQLIINTGTTIVTFLMVFLIQNTQNRDARAIHLKLNELIHAVDKAKNQMMDVENLSDMELEELTRTYERMRSTAETRRNSRGGNSST